MGFPRAYRGSGVARVFFVQYAGGESKGYEAFRSLVDKDAETSFSPTARLSSLDKEETSNFGRFSQN